MRSIHVSLKTEKNKLNSTAAFLSLLQIEVGDDEVRYFVPNTENVTFDGITYEPFPCKLNSIQQDLRGGLEDVEVAVSNVTREMSAYVEFNDLRGRQVKMLTVSTAHLDNPTATLEEVVFEINEVSVQEEAVIFLLGHERILQQRFPGQRFLRNNCRWVYKSKECGYSGGMATCSKILEGIDGCRAHNNVARFGAFPGLPSVGGRIS